MQTATKKCVIWRVADGKRGHENQSEGLVQALADLMPVQTHSLSALTGAKALQDWVMLRFPSGDGLPDPALIVGAGRTTHLTLLAARRARGGKAVVVMNPGLPRACFDLCLIPAHDGVSPAPNVLITRGALNTVRQSAHKDTGSGLMLLGGESKHYMWDVAGMVAQVQAIALHTPQMRWTLTNSRRTPPETMARLQTLGLSNVQLVSHEATTAAWLPEQLANAAQVWVTPDSVSMVYEALTSGAAVGLFRLQAQSSGRVVCGIGALAKEGLLIEYDTWLQRGLLQGLQQEFNEAARCARWIKDHWFPNL